MINREGLCYMILSPPPTYWRELHKQVLWGSDFSRENFSIQRSTFPRCPSHVIVPHTLNSLKQFIQLLLTDVAPTVRRGKTFWRVNRFFFYENGCNSGTESQKIVPKVGTWTAKRAVDQNWGRLAKIGFLAKNRDFGPKKNGPLLHPNHVLAETGKSFQRKKLPLPK